MGVESERERALSGDLDGVRRAFNSAMIIPVHHEAKWIEERVIDDGLIELIELMN